MTWFDDHAKDNFDRLVPQTTLRVCQIGVWEGDATMWLLDNRDVEFIVDVDPWTGDQGVQYGAAEAAYDRKVGHHPKVQKVRLRSDDFFASNTRQFNFVYVDGDHDPVQVFRDGMNGWTALEPGGIMAFDDYAWESRGVRPGIGIDFFLVTVKPQVIHKNYQVWVTK